MVASRRMGAARTRSTVAAMALEMIGAVSAYARQAMRRSSSRSACSFSHCL